MKITPNSWFDYIRPDEVAECWEGVLDAGLYEPLWSCVESYKAPSPEESEEPCVGMDCITDFWDRFTPEQQQLLNQLADRNDVTGSGQSVGFDPFNI